METAVIKGRVQVEDLSYKVINDGIEITIRTREKSNQGLQYHVASAQNEIRCYFREYMASVDETSVIFSFDRSNEIKLLHNCVSGLEYQPHKVILTLVRKPNFSEAKAISLSPVKVNQ